MNNYFNMANKKILALIKELSVDAENLMDDLKDEEEKSKVSLILLYYKIILQGCIRFGSEANNYVRMLRDCSIDESDIELILDKYCDKPVEKVNNSDIVLDENPPINVDVDEIYNINDIVLDENPPINIEVGDISDFKYGEKSGEIVLDENPPISVNVSEVKDIDIDGEEICEHDIVLDENPPISIEVEEVYGNHDIVIDENPPIDIDVEEIYESDDIVLDENPPINIKVDEITSDNDNDNDIVFDENPPIDIDVESISDIGDIGLPNQNDNHSIELDENVDIKIDVEEIKPFNLNNDENKKKKVLPLFGKISFEVADVSDTEPFDADSFRKQVEAERKAKRDKKNKKNKNK